MSAVQVLLNFVQRVKYVDTPGVIIPAIPCRQAHPVKQEAVQQLCVRGDFLELLSCDKLAGNAVKRKLAAFIAVIIVECS